MIMSATPVVTARAWAEEVQREFQDYPGGEQIARDFEIELARMGRGEFSPEEVETVIRQVLGSQQEDDMVRRLVAITY